ncbi:MAG: T9SS type A sorting domain-containing protein [Bacteroidetes bacterium]|nr:T9SS type A sorting domain-containing protein [Bacteroidota bacterium]
MKKLFLCLLTLAATYLNAQAAPGDTTWVQAQNGIWLNYYNNFDTTIAFPNGNTSYRRVYMYFTLGKYACPGSPQYCADWDYTVQTFLMTPGGDTVELGRLITPYANSSRMTSTWKGVYAYDVTDFYPILKNNATVRIHYSGYSGGFTADVKFAFIEGTPARNVVGGKRIWKNSYNYGWGSTDINTALGNVSLTAPSNAQFAEARFTITGHGGDQQNCAEFCPNTYTMNLNNNQLVQQNFWRADCGSNNYYPQNGTWVFNRAGWCPGDKVLPYSHPLTGVTANSNFQLNVNFPAYTSNPSSSGSQAIYTIEGDVIYYGAFNHTLDASLDDIMAPTDNQQYFRMNPLTGKPTIKVKNTGSATITSLNIVYGVVGSYLPNYYWTGSIAPLETKEITLPEPWGLRVASGTGNTFSAQIVAVNGTADEDNSNNLLTSTFTAAPVWTTQIRVSLRTNGSVSNGVSETSWKIYDLDNNIVAQRTNNTVNTTYDDTLKLGPAVYRLEVSDAGCDGVNWWMYPYYNPNPGVGYVQIRNIGSFALIPLKGYFNGDFGCGFTQYFRTDWTTSIATPEMENATIEAFPSPAQQKVTVSINGVNSIDGLVNIVDMSGRTMMQQKVSKATTELDISALANGVYSMIYDYSGGRVQTKLVIAR